MLVCVCVRGGIVTWCHALHRPDIPMLCSRAQCGCRSVSVWVGVTAEKEALSATLLAQPQEPLIKCYGAGFMLCFAKPGQESCNSSIWYGIANRNIG